VLGFLVACFCLSFASDLNHPNQYVVGLALCALANIGSPGLCRDCAPDVEKLLESTNPYIRKKVRQMLVTVMAELNWHVWVSDHLYLSLSRINA
jgi:vesicle coat complex subunit